MNNKDRIKELEDQVQSKSKYARSLWDELQEIKKKYYEPLSKEEQIKEIAVEFGKFLITMNVKSVDYPNTFRTNTGLAPDMLVETMEQMYDRHILSKVPFIPQKNKKMNNGI